MNIQKMIDKLIAGEYENKKPRGNVLKKLFCCDKCKKKFMKEEYLRIGNKCLTNHKELKNRYQQMEKEYFQEFEIKEKEFKKDLKQSLKAGELTTKAANLAIKYTEKFRTASDKIDYVDVLLKIIELNKDR